ncbi:hypothetical protein [Frankia sp. Cj3]|uniref:hypothetical protein n=1 Tax=Frankia sp. Cj3 TaxID=2880976 RepID=UPI001EF6377F|nr:hypothetical protein [Frankia sp. Cj3]
MTTVGPLGAARPFRLGRHVHHDPRSLAYGAPALPYAALRSVRWTRRIAILDQGDLGSCVGNAAAGWLGTDNAARRGMTHTPGGKIVDEAYARDLYARATQTDAIPGEYPPDDTGSTGLAVAKALRSGGLIRRYEHAFGLRATLSALSTLGPVLLGITWFEAMFEPGVDGQLIPDGAPVGGHELLADEIDTVGQRVWLANSWSDKWGIGGRAWLSWEHLRYLLGLQGDVIAPR